jgi:hypothetical protein
MLFLVNEVHRLAHEVHRLAPRCAPRWHPMHQRRFQGVLRRQ